MQFIVYDLVNIVGIFPEFNVFDWLRLVGRWLAISTQANTIEAHDQAETSRGGSPLLVSAQSGRVMVKPFCVACV